MVSILDMGKEIMNDVNYNHKKAITVNNLTKFYKLYNDPKDRLIEALNPLKKEYHKKFYALEDFNLEVKKGEIAGIIGRNGSGKSTLLKILTGVLAPSSGKIQINGKITALLELGGGFNPEKTGIQNIYFNGALNGLSAQELENIIQEVIDFADIGDFIDQPVKTYSSGMLARLAFSLAINVEPEILIIDEILAVGDAAFQRKCFAKIEEFKRSGRTILFVSHSSNQIVQICDKAVWVSNGKKVIEGSPKFVSSLYSQNSQKDKIDFNKIRNEFNALTKTISAPKDNFKNRINNRKTQYAPTANPPQSKQKIYNENLTPKSTVYYPQKGAKIINTHITTLSGEKVNILNRGEEYLYKYTVLFDTPVNKVLFGMMIKTKEGYMLGGGHFPKKEEFILVKGLKADLAWKWKCNLIQGVYFFNAGVSDKNGYLNRILDSYMFKVQPSSKKEQSVGLIDFEIDAKLLTEM